MNENAVDSTTAATASAGVSDTTVVTGSGAAGVSVDTASGWYKLVGQLHPAGAQLLLLRRPRRRP